MTWPRLQEPASKLGHSRSEPEIYSNLQKLRRKGGTVNVVFATDMSSVAYRLALGGADGWYRRGWSFGFFIFAPFTPAGRYERLDLAMLQL